jgi:predicted dehydrogenase
VSKLRVGVIGLGEVAQVIHLPVLESLPDKFEIAAVCDISPSLLATVGDRYGVPGRYADSADLLRSEQLDGVLVLNSDEYHAECAVNALERGVNVFVEKPMCLSPREAEAIIAARDKSDGAQVMVGYMRRFAPAFLEAKEQLASLGPVNYVRVHDIIGKNQLIIDQMWNVHRPGDIPEAMVADKWERASKLVQEALGSVPDELAWTYRLLCGLGSHDLSAMRELFGKPKRVLAARQWRSASFVTALFEYDDFVATYETGVDDQVRFDAHIEVYGQSAQLRIQYDTPYVRHFPTTVVVERTNGDALERSVSRPHLKDPYTAELEYFHAMVTEGFAPKTTPEDFVEDLALFAEMIKMMAASAEDGSYVETEHTPTDTDETR